MDSSISFDEGSHCDFLHDSSTIMNSLRVARAAVRARPTALKAPVLRRGYADVAEGKIQVTLALPHQVRMTVHDALPPVAGDSIGYRAGERYFKKR